VLIGGPWTLTDFNSQKFGSDDLKGWNYLIYFGFAKCPDICPTTLMYLTSLKRHLKNLPGY
jgi:protein SCO1/2